LRKQGADIPSRGDFIVRKPQLSFKGKLPKTKSEISEYSNFLAAEMFLASPDIQTYLDSSESYYKGAQLEDIYGATYFRHLGLINLSFNQALQRSQDPRQIKE